MKFSLSPFPCIDQRSSSQQKKKPKESKKKSHRSKGRGSFGDMMIVKNSNNRKRCRTFNVSSWVSSPKELNEPRAHPQMRKAEGERGHLFLLGELLGSNVRATQLDVEHALHRGENLLVWGGGATLEVLYNGDGGVALGGEFLLGHLVALLSSALLDGICNGVANGLGLDDIVTAVDLGQVLAVGGAGLRRL
jgi:hypothetical protein